MIQKRRTRSRDLSKITPPKQKQEKGYCQSCHVLVPIEKAPRHAWEMQSPGNWPSKSCRRWLESGHICPTPPISWKTEWRGKKKYWIRFHYYDCPVCGRHDEIRERIYEQLKPADITQRHIVHQAYDWCDVL